MEENDVKQLEEEVSSLATLPVSSLVDRIIELKAKLAEKDKTIADLHGVLVAGTPRGHGFSRKGR
jgi:hypothetical protein